MRRGEDVVHPRVRGRLHAERGPERFSPRAHALDLHVPHLVHHAAQQRLPHAGFARERREFLQRALVHEGVVPQPKRRGGIEPAEDPALEGALEEDVEDDDEDFEDDGEEEEQDDEIEEGEEDDDNDEVDAEGESD